MSLPRGASAAGVAVAVALLAIITVNVIWSAPTTAFVPDRVGVHSTLLRKAFMRETTWTRLPLRDFGSFVAAGQLAATGQNPYGDHPLVFRPVFTGAQAGRDADTVQPTASPNLNPPLSVVAFQLLATVDPATAYRVWYGVSLGLALIALGALWKAFPETATPLRLLWALALAGLWHVLELGQIYLPLVLATIGAWLLLRQRRHLTAGLLIGFVVAFKPTFVLWPLLLLLSAGWLAGVAALATAALLSLIPLLIYGPAIYLQWLQATAAATNALMTVPGNSSLVGIAARLGIPGLGYVAVGALIITLGVWVWRRRPPVLVVSTLALLAALLAGPLTWAGYTLLLLPALLSRPWSPLLRLAAALLVVPFLVVLHLSMVSPAVAAATGGLYGWALLILLGVTWWEALGAPRLPLVGALTDTPRLFLAGMASAALYAWCLTQPFFLPTFDLARVPPDDSGLLFLRWLHQGGWDHLLTRVGALVIAAVIYGYAWRVARHTTTRAARLTVFGVAAGLGVLLWFMAPAMTSDLYDYAVRGRQIALYQQDPLVTPVAAMGADPWVRLTYWRDIPSPYGPAWQGMNALTYLAAGADLLRTLAGFKLLGLTAVLVGGVLIDRILARTAPAERTAGVLLYTWNPLVLIEVVGNGHNDGVMLVLVLVSLLAFVAGRWLAVFPALTIAALIKVTALLILPILVVMAVREARDCRRSRRTLLVGAGLAGGLAVGAYGLAWAGPATLSHITSGVGTAMNSPVASIGWVLRRFGYPLATVTSVARVIGLLMVAGGMLAVVIRLWRRPKVVPEEVLRATFDMVALYLMVGAAWFFPWYVTWLLAMAALIQHPGRQRAAMVFSVLVLALYVVPAPGYLGASYYSHAILVAIAFGAFIGLLGWAAWATGNGPLATAWRAVTRRVPLVGAGRPLTGGD